MFSLKLSSKETVQRLVFYGGLLCPMLLIFGILSEMLCDLLEEHSKHSCRKFCIAITPGKVYLDAHWGPETYKWLSKPCGNYIGSKLACV